MLLVRLTLDGFPPSVFDIADASSVDWDFSGSDTGLVGLPASWPCLPASGPWLSDASLDSGMSASGNAPELHESEVFPISDEDEPDEKVCLLEAVDNPPPLCTIGRCLPDVARKSLCNLCRCLNPAPPACEWLLLIRT